MEEDLAQPSGHASLSLAEYVSAVAGLPPPSQAQAGAFAAFVSQAHSWYKHLPLYLPGARFQFFIDPFAGCDRIVTKDGLQVVPRTAQGFHYSWIPTDEYRQRFGYLAYSTGSGTSVALQAGEKRFVPGDDTAAVLAGPRLRELPPEVLEAGAVRLTAVIHSLSAAHPWWDQRRGAQSPDWPAGSGGQATLEKIFARCRAMREKPLRARNVNDPEVLRDPNMFFVDSELYELLTPERERQQREMVQAMQRVCDLVYSP